MRRGDVTSDEKLTHPGESIRSIKNLSPVEYCSQYHFRVTTKRVMQLPTIIFLLDRRKVLVDFKVHQDGSGFNGNTVLFSSFLVSANHMSPALAEAMMPAFETEESVKGDFP